MKCPYNLKSQTLKTIRQTNADKETGVFTQETIEEVISYEQTDCIEDECAKWQYGQCTM